MQLLDKVKSLLGKKESLQEYFLALIFREKSIKAVIWEEKEGQVAVVDSAAVACEKNIEEIEDDKLLTLADQAIGLAEKSLPENAKTTKTIFGLSDWWIEGNAIKNQYLSKLKTISKNLGLSPLGFVVIPEAIIHLLKQQESTPPTILLVELGDELLGIALVRAGRIEITKIEKKDGKSDSEKAAEIIKSFGDVEILPSRMLLFDGEIPLEEAKQEFISYPWTKELPFLHFPKIDILQEDEDIKAVVSGAAKEMGFSFEEKLEEEETIETHEAEEPQAPEEEVAFGFIKDSDIAQDHPKAEDIHEANAKIDVEEPTQIPVQSEESSQIKLPAFNIQSVFSPLTKLTSLIGSIRLPRPPLGGFLLPILLIIIVLVLAVAGLLFYIPRATLTLFMQTRTLENDVEITIDTNITAVDKEKKKISGTTIEATLEGNKEGTATGKKTVGNRAKGEVTIYNKTENKKTFPKGTILLGPQSLRFTLDEEVSIASTPAFELTSSSIKAKVTAEQIGDESNLASNTNFPFKDFPTSSYFAKNDSPFGGGTKREIQVVSRGDQETLLTSLTDELQGRAKEELINKSQGRRIVDIDMKKEIITKEYSKKVDDETDKFSLKLSVSFNTVAYKDSDLLEIIGGEIEKNTPSGFTFQNDKFETSVKNVGKEKSGALALTMHYKATLLPKIDEEAIKNAVVGKSKTAVEAYLKSLPLEDFSIAQNVRLPQPLNLLPLQAKNITIEVKTK